jgi:hypothetical protein
LWCAWTLHLPHRRSGRARRYNIRRSTGKY